MTKQEALDKIEELKQYVEGLDREITDFALGDVFCSKSNNNKIVILPFGYNTGLYCFGGRFSEPCRPWSNGGEEGMDRNEVLRDLNSTGDLVKIGTLKF